MREGARRSAGAADHPAGRHRVVPVLPGHRSVTAEPERQPGHRRDRIGVQGLERAPRDGWPRRGGVRRGGAGGRKWPSGWRCQIPVDQRHPSTTCDQGIRALPFRSIGGRPALTNSLSKPEPFGDTSAASVRRAEVRPGEGPRPDPQCVLAGAGTRSLPGAGATTMPRRANDPPCRRARRKRDSLALTPASPSRWPPSSPGQDDSVPACNPRKHLPHPGRSRKTPLGRRPRRRPRIPRRCRVGDLGRRPSRLDVERAATAPHQQDEQPSVAMVPSPMKRDIV